VHHVICLFTSQLSLNEVGIPAVNWWAVTFGTARMGLGGAAAVPNVTVHPSTASVPNTVVLYSGPLLCSFYVPIEG